MALPRWMGAWLASETKEEEPVGFFLRFQDALLPVSVPKDGVSRAFALHHFKASGGLLEHSGIKVPSLQLEQIRSTVT